MNNDYTPHEISYKGRCTRDENGKFWYLFEDVYKTLHLENHPHYTDAHIMFYDISEEHKLIIDEQDLLLIDKAAFVDLANQMGESVIAWALYLFGGEANYDNHDKAASKSVPEPKRKNWRDHPGIREQFIRQKGLCYYCHEPLLDGWVVEHVKPLSKRGDDELHNLVIACATCNGKKHAKSPHEWPEGGRLC